MTKKTNNINKRAKVNQAKKKIKKMTFLSRVFEIAKKTLSRVGKFFTSIWNWICSINLVGLVNTTLLLAIIILFSMLIIDVSGCKKEQIVIVQEKVPVTQQVVVTDENAPSNIRMRGVTLPLKNTLSAQKHDMEPINVVPVKKAEVSIVKKQTPQNENKLWGDVIIDSRASGAILKNKSQVNGNLYLQNMRKFVLPCDIHVNGNLFLRDVNMLQFCGDFVITGNIYVSPRSSFGPIPKTAKLGGHVVL